MPKETFFNLKEEKQARILNAAKEVFKQKSFDKASINEIIKLAEIPRGSFYQYFEDKEDIYAYMMLKRFQNNLQEFKAILKNKQGDLFATAKEFVPKLLSKITQGDDSELFYQIAINEDYRRMQRNHHQHQEVFLKEMYDLVDEEKLRIENKQDLSMLLHAMFMPLGVTLYNTLKEIKAGQKIDVHEKINAYYHALELFEHGFSKEGGN